MMTQERRVEKLKQIAEYYGISRNVDFAKFFGISEPTAFNRMKMGVLDFEEIYSKCPDISADWLLGDEGPMLRVDRDKNLASNNTNIGDNAKQSVSVVEGEALKNALEALHREQDALARSQEQISGLIEVLRVK